MSVTTKNIFGKVSISDDCLAAVAGYVALSTYGVAELVPRSLTDNIAELFNKQKNTKGVRVITNKDKITIDLNVIMQSGVPVAEVTKSLQEAVKFSLENFSGMIVDTVRVSVVGSKLE
ncbi:MAG: Asp23/Gls24 family envelope stress response protein [Firmicutes bacterium]|nr:Asp23/Gls24 family envelope stress response protein [Bacillota bacterium]